MNTFLSTGTLALIIVGILLFLSLAGVLLYFVFFQHMRYKAQAKELIRRFEYLHSLLIGQDAHWVKTIERIATTNLLFASRHQTFEKRFKELRDRGDASAQKAVNDLKDLIEDRDYKGLKAALPEARRIMQEYDDAANSLHNDLHALILPMEECNANSLHMKEQFRSIKQDYFVKPIAYEDLKLALDNVCPRIEREQDTMTLNVAVKNGVRRVAFSEIRFIESRGHTIIYHLAEEVLRVRGNSLSSMEKKLRPYGFACCNASFLVNLNYCVSLLGENLAMADGTVLHVTRTKRKEFIQILSDFMARTGIEEERK